MELSFSKPKFVLLEMKIRDVGKLQHFLQRSPKLFSHNRMQKLLPARRICRKINFDNALDEFIN